MSPIEDYFFSNNIEVWSHRQIGSLIWFNTDAGMFIQTEIGYLFKQDDDKSERVV